MSYSISESLVKELTFEGLRAYALSEKRAQLLKTVSEMIAEYLSKLRCSGTFILTPKPNQTEDTKYSSALEIFKYINPQNEFLPIAAVLVCWNDHVKERALSVFHWSANDRLVVQVLGENSAYVIAIAEDTVIKQEQFGVFMVDLVRHSYGVCPTYVSRMFDKLNAERRRTQAKP